MHMHVIPSLLPRTCLLLRRLAGMHAIISLLPRGLPPPKLLPLHLLPPILPPLTPTLSSAASHIRRAASSLELSEGGAASGACSQVGLTGFQ